MLGTVVNVITIILGSTLGLLLKKGIPERYKETVMQGIGLAVLLIGLKMAFQANNELIVILSLVIGGLIGEGLKIDYYLDVLAQKLQGAVGAKEGDFVKAFVTTSLVYCVGAMAIMGPIESGLTGNHKILFAKSTLDGISAVVFASTLGVGVIFSALPVFIYQGGITILAVALKDILSQPVIDYMTATGGLLIVAIGLNILGIKELKVANLLPAVFVSIAFTLIALNFFSTYV
ncbi:MAG: DUF554 domain-containing protein [Clostridia bacterium]|jgi:uncharacterized membrane protein YqgA involved in biofilm formation|nr:DUF554 domain-containing protein [Clostridia bacterium]